MEQLVDRLGNEKGTKIIQREVHEPVEYSIEEETKENEIIVKQKLFTTFAEVELEFDSIEPLLMATFSYMPSNIEIISPENFVLKNHDISGILTGIVVRLHRYDEVTKKLVVDREILESQLKHVLERTKQEGKNENIENHTEKKPKKSKKSQK
jgi:hypothetical protein